MTKTFRQLKPKLISQSELARALGLLPHQIEVMTHNHIPYILEGKKAIMFNLQHVIFALRDSNKMTYEIMKSLCNYMKIPQNKFPDNWKGARLLDDKS